MDWTEIYPEIDWIKDEKLRRLVADCWAAAADRGGWTEADLRAMPFTLLIEAESPDIVTHTRAVTAIARQAGKVMSEYISLDMDQLIAGAILHDVGKPLEFAREGDRFIKSASGRLVRHPASGAALAAEFGLSPKVQHIIAYHSHEGDRVNRTPEALIVFHADFTFFESIRAV
jgi:putative nucleotidyltransferase with HDIG domain